MAILEQKINLKNSCKLIGKSKDIFAPIKEAIINSFDAINERQNTNTSFIPLILLSIHYKTIKNLLGEETRILDFITVEDNGIGFTTDNLSRFKNFGESSKNMNNRGTGKIQIFCRFNQISIDSIFFETGKWYNLNANWKISGEYEGKPIEIENKRNNKTIVKMSDFSSDDKEQDFFLKYIDNIDELKRDVLKRFLLLLWHGATKHDLKLTIKIYLNKNKQNEFTFDISNIPKPDEGKIAINTEQATFIYDKEAEDKVKIEWTPVEPKMELSVCRFKIADTNMDENGIFLCSKNIVVESFKFPSVRKNASFKGFRYLTSISGDVLDDPMYVNQAVDGFLFPSKRKIEAEYKEGQTSLFNQENKFIFWDEIKNKIGQGLIKMYSDIEGMKEKREKDIALLAKQYGISLEDVEGSDVQLNDTEEEATEKLFKTQAKRLAKQSMEIQKTYTEIKKLETKKLDPTSKNYRTRLGELSNKLLEIIPQQNKDELARYIIRRDMVVELLKLALKNELVLQEEWAKKKAQGEKIRQDNEGIIHDIIFKRRMKGVSNDLWILNEEFVHFDGCSDIELDKIEINNEKLLKEEIIIDDALRAVGITRESYLKQRPDIFLFPEEGKCILIELKAPGLEISMYCDQIQKYARLIANYSQKPFIQFYGFLIGETIDRVNVPGRYIRVPHGNYWFYPNEPIKSINEEETIKANIYQEIMPLSEIAKRAEIRNKSFAEKLGISSNDIIRAKKELQQGIKA
jgi:hypothetical protein